MQIASAENLRGGGSLFHVGNFPKHRGGDQGPGGVGFVYKTAAFVWIKKNRKNGGNFWGMGAYTRANAEVCLLGVSQGLKARERVRSHRSTR